MKDPIGRALRSPVVAVLLVAGLGVGLNFWRLQEARYFIDEKVWMKEGEHSLRLLLKGDFDDPFWVGERSTYGYPSAPISKLFIGAALRTSEESAIGQRGRPSPELLGVGRRSAALAGVVGSLAFLAIARRILGPAAGLGATLLLVTSPTWLAASRAAMADMHAACFTLVSTYLFLLTWERVHRAERPWWSLGWFAATGGALGVAVGSRFSAGGPAIALGLLAGGAALWQLRSPAGRSRGAALLVGTALMTGVAAAVFVAGYPYLHEHTLERAFGLVGYWEEVWESRIRGEGRFWTWNIAYRPGLVSFEELARVLLLPGNIAAWLMLPALSCVAWRTRLGPDRTRLVGLALATPALVAGYFGESRILLSWIVWVGLVAALLGTLAAPVRLGIGRRARQAALVFAVATTGVLAITLRQTHIGWARYYLPFVPACCLLAAWAFDSLLEALERSGSTAAAYALVAACVLGALSVAASGPAFDATMEAAARWMRSGRSAAPQALGLAAAAALALTPILCAISLRSRPVRSG